ncbi:hypothetical protein COY07_03075 [Candidatus Peregrinibacteria bacterium CG_4_10_14_0_2_um_filter_43_11]|nr:MAG: hypothetical protein COY07_03075 [Candidatus Peregrinibacteria bacterium CG_4_10_14_0_2_um_filter_43_11]
MSTLTINLDPVLKSKAQKKAKKEGLTLTALIAQFFKSYLNDECGLTLKLKNEIVETMKELDEDIKNGTAKAYSNAHEMFEDILNEPDDDEKV